MRTYQKLTEDQRQLVDDCILLHVKHNSGKSIPAKELANRTNTTEGKVCNRIIKLLEAGKIKKVTHKTYALVDQPQQPTQASLPVEPVTPQANNSESKGGVDPELADKVEAKAMEYFWIKDSSIGMSYFRDFIAWLRGDKDEPAK
jgi:biotin operon repressor